MYPLFIYISHESLFFQTPYFFHDLSLHRYQGTLSCIFHTGKKKKKAPYIPPSTVYWKWRNVHGAWGWCWNQPLRFLCFLSNSWSSTLIDQRQNLVSTWCRRVCSSSAKTVQRPARVNTTQLWWSGGLRGLANCHVSYRPSEHDTRTPTHIPRRHTLRFQEFTVKHGAVYPLWILISFPFKDSFRTQYTNLHRNCFLWKKATGSHDRYFETFMTIR